MTLALLARLRERQSQVSLANCILGTDSTVQKDAAAPSQRVTASGSGSGSGQRREQARAGEGRREDLDGAWNGMPFVDVVATERLLVAILREEFKNLDHRVSIVEGLCGYVTSDNTPKCFDGKE